MRDQLKEIYISLSRAIEDGRDIQIGIVLGQVLCKINDLINEDQTDEGTDGVILSTTCEHCQCFNVRGGSAVIQGNTLPGIYATNSNQTTLA